MNMAPKFKYDLTTAKVATKTLPLMPVRMIDDPPQHGVTMQVFINGTWTSICTLRNSGTLGLWDIRAKSLREAGFVINGLHQDEQSTSTIQTHVQ